MSEIKKLPAVRWTESEAGWGQRPDGFTVHRDENEAHRYISNFWEKEKERNPSGRPPAEYSFPSDKIEMIEVSDALYEAVQKDGSAWGHYSSWNFSHALEWKPRETT